jgi:hypothetical protein
VRERRLSNPLRDAAAQNRDLVDGGLRVYVTDWHNARDIPQ